MKSVKTKPILWFLQSKGWKEEKQSERFHILRPPKELPFEGKAQFYVPLEKFESSVDFLNSVSGLLDSIAFLYSIDIQELKILFSKTPEELQKDIEYRKGMLAQAN